METIDIRYDDPMPTSIPLHEGLDLLRKASSDDAFRDALTARPAEVLASLGLDVAQSDLPDQISLPSKSSLEETLEKKASWIDWLELVRWRFQPPRA